MISKNAVEAIEMYFPDRIFVFSSVLAALKGLWPASPETGRGNTLGERSE